MLIYSKAYVMEVISAGEERVCTKLGVVWLRLDRPNFKVEFYILSKNQKLYLKSRVSYLNRTTLSFRLLDCTLSSTVLKSKFTATWLLLRLRQPHLTAILHNINDHDTTVIVTMPWFKTLCLNSSQDKGQLFDARMKKKLCPVINYYRLLKTV